MLEHWAGRQGDVEPTALCTRVDVFVLLRRPLSPALWCACLTTPARHMKRHAEDVRVEGEEAGGAVKQRKEQEGGHAGWVVALQSPQVAEDIVRVMSKDPYEEWRGPEPDTLAFLEDTAHTLRLER